ncbi:MAG: aspartate--tRNA(Asn) ligase [Oscillospiraceae bacterium]|nr:aspartate--tRNA(Asn) ligase [Oscillospiraceae bacterium]MBQ8978965.1 aspartate--tRNA(Asn) ligase [Oscillospiraceae bacterium]
MRTVSGNTLIKEFDVEAAKAAVGSEVTISATVHKVNDMGAFAFVHLRTARYVIQTVYAPDSCKGSLEGIKEGCFVKATGIVRTEERSKTGIEIALTSIELLHAPGYDYPLHVSKWKLGCSLDVNLDNRSVALRNPAERAVFKFQEGVVSAFRQFMLDNDFTEIHTPKIVAQGAEGGANIFRLEYFDKDAFLNQSPQFYKQAAVAFFDRVFEIAPVYRAEKHSTSRHLNEYIGLDFEMGFINDMYDVMDMETAMLRYMIGYLKENYAQEIRILGADIPEVGEIPAIKFEDAVTLIKGSKAKNKFDLEPEDEVFLCNWAKENYGTEFIFVTNFPASKPPFYAMNDKEDPRTACKFDLLFRGLEITTGGQRIHDYNEQLEKMKAQGLDPNDFVYYLESHKYGLPPHGGLGIGLERLVMKLLGLQNVRQASMFPRDIARLTP